MSTPASPATVASADCAAGPTIVEDLKRFSDASMHPTLLFDDTGRFHYFNRAFRSLAHRCARDPAAVTAAATLADLAVEIVPQAALVQVMARGEWSGEVVLGAEPGPPLVLDVQVVRLDGAEGAVRLGATFRDATEAYGRSRELQRRNVEVEAANATIRGAQEQLLQTEKLASIGQLAAGVAHEINNPMGYVHSNLETLVTYTEHLLTLIEAYDGATSGLSGDVLAEIGEMRQRFDIDFVRTDLPQLLAESREGVERVRKIIQDLKDFSRSDAPNGWVLADLHRGLDSTLNIVWNELKYKVRLTKQYGDVPRIRCLPSELNQVFLNILVNAGQAVEQNGNITITTSVEDNDAVISIADDGIGMPEDMLPRIFDPFFTTKPVGKGTGLGLSISYGIIKKHHGRIEVRSTPGQGTEFRIVLPLEQAVG